ncbi:MalY/PatB family protein [Mycobacterium xenopi]|uniref:cysteine-S-conjugate beta-lyase n=3 Tax=Mycobacterium xenopi TaxID=1789 RepID=A0AAD1GZP1_MYCXE|nr:MalY/PatB family protein [Mycobacterium xenopi]MDA3638896.1 pyridoxal phosphate-dependent aminotransferase [Mycobacterium xenopi]MDA3656998.1 pyridoxal phosphate-dependent aminotransferase [Mycobacterium xenopi]ORX12230.1 aminotransferase [Mycobacterium xenopi]SPX93580.1 aminotransferase [Mycobacterium xenopi]BBU21791.1 aminotransferase [Mycobacterium xenopi]
MTDWGFDALTEERLRQRKTIKWNYFEPDVLPLWIAEMDFPTAPVVVDAARACVANEEFGYPPVDDELPQATADWCRRRYGWDVQADWVRVVPDVLKGMEAVVNFLTRPESPVVLPVPAYMPFFDVLRVTGRQRAEIPMLQDVSGRYVMDLDALDAAFASGAGSLILCNPNNPLGTAFTAEELRAIVEIAARHGARVIADEIHAPLVYERPHVAAASVSDAAADTVVTLVSASKGWNLPGLMCAQVILSNRRDATEWDRINMLHKMGASTVGIRANIAAYRRGGPWLDELLRYLKANRDHLAQRLPELIPGVKVNTPDATYMSWVDFRALNLPAEPADYLLSKAKVALSPGIPFGAKVSAGFARLNFGTTRAILDRAITAMAAAMPA